MEQYSQFEVVFMEDASEFLKNLQPQASKKIYYNIIKVAGRNIMKLNKEIMEKMKLYTMGELLNRDIGPVGTEERDNFEREVAEDIHAFHVGEAIKQARLSQSLTQEQLGKKVGVQKAQISRLERGKSISLSSMARVFKAMGIPLTLEVGNIGKVALW